MNKTDWKSIEGIKRKDVGGKGVICVGSRKSG
jgi:hypothetical protein